MLPKNKSENIGGLPYTKAHQKITRTNTAQFENITAILQAQFDPNSVFFS